MSAELTSHAEGSIQNLRNGSRDNAIVGSTSNNFGSMAAFRQHVNESHHDFINLLTQQMTTILNPIMADHETKFERLARQVERVARIVNYNEGDHQNLGVNPESLGNNPRDMNDNMNLDGNVPRVVRCDQNDDDVLDRIRVNQQEKCYQVTRIVEDVLNRVGINVGFMN
ncbi:hypothetical protein Ahy_B05g076495 [Arachis hypogaea]|uniref:Uncharacterized protein n=1 Tax=Arachis hypogaea TaxID=3818 RepID=A0A444Z3R6_ARAHY|nr:hypothetical protein Ahy_B05g076495 [Arachis hypogaea]